MKIKSILLCLAVIAFATATARAQEQQQQQPAATVAQSPAEQPVPLAQRATALDASGREALSASLLTTGPLQGTPEAPTKNVRFNIENRSPIFYTYVSGIITFYREGGARCGEGQFALNALAPAETAETDAPGLRLECTPTAWRIVASSLLTRTPDAALPPAPPTEPLSQPAPPPATPSPLYLTVDGKVYQVPLNSTLDIPVRRRNVRITVSDRP